MSMLQVATTRLTAAGIDTATLDARLLLQHALGVSSEALIAEPDRALSKVEQAKYEQLIARREAREPLAYITGMREFFGLNFFVTPDVLIPRPDSETLVEAVLERVTHHTSRITILDLGTGSGCLLLSLLQAIPHATGVGVDASRAALAVAKRNAEALQLADRAEFLESDWCSALGLKKYEIVVANPPYIVSDAVHALMPEVAQFEPVAALDGGEDGLGSYREIARTLLPHVASGAWVAVEAGAGQAEAIAGIFAASGFKVEAIRHDLSGIARCVLFKLAMNQDYQL